MVRLVILPGTSTNARLGQVGLSTRAKAVAPRALLRSGLIRRPAAVCNGAQMLSSMVGDLDLMPDVVLRERTQEGDQHQFGLRCRTSFSSR